ncbi:MAG: 1-(5-phosphoribosyl)-5-[(5-phosphoribosylamino)methylideneamino]imidazole-4-carboxamide isomerase [Candidatus Margulisiibacteriota bacterium]|jgi:phosphoribosylformimino-5-aminoimidazole carboxamide ribotide isomerase
MANNNFLIIPAIDILDGKVVRLFKGDYNQKENFNYEPQDLAKLFSDQGIKRIHLVDLNGAKDGNLTNKKTIKAIRASVKCELELGGGIRNQSNVQELFDLGLDYLIIGSILGKNIEESASIIKQYPNKIIAGLDSKNDYLAIQGWLNESKILLSDLIKSLHDLPLNSIIYTDINKDGTLTGPNIKKTLEIANLSKFPVIASGGISGIEDILTLKKLADQNIKGCIVGKALLSGRVSLEEIIKQG